MIGKRKLHIGKNLTKHESKRTLVTNQVAWKTVSSKTVASTTIRGIEEGLWVPKSFRLDFLKQLIVAPPFSLKVQNFEIYSSEMVKNAPNIPEGNIEVFCSEMTKIPLKNFHRNCRKSFEIW